ncbi:zinc-binding dehydrogenase [Sodalis-like endosymbiont of Proechinophthirus fluctus]|uniref:zinc-binding dehydrogenase n=1 Tax=Sodalis-like endosymbiont of Proechinophthirus fluctus TaxID=1462730 RepID=UPI00082F30C2|nr:zinc-binding dehydrogenase [Sodalis-like endosymbiont of Proechinophthirus fluctus]
MQYALATELNIDAVDIDDSKLELAKQLGASVTVNARNSDDPVAHLKQEIDTCTVCWLPRLSPCI